MILKNELDVWPNAVCSPPQAMISPQWGSSCRYNSSRSPPYSVCLFLVCSDLGLSSAQCTNVLSTPRLDCLHSFPLSVFLHGCVQCVYPSSVWKHHLLLGCSICICHHGPHHLQSQVSTPSFVITLFVSCPGIDIPIGISSHWCVALPFQYNLCWWQYVKSSFKSPWTATDCGNSSRICIMLLI